MARTNLLQHRSRDLRDLEVNYAFESGTRPVAPKIVDLSSAPEETRVSIRPTVPAPTDILTALAQSSIEGTEDIDSSGVPKSEKPTVRPPAFRPMVVPGVRDVTSLPPARPSLSARSLGSLDRVPFILEPGKDLRHISLDHREAFVLSRIDGRSDIEELLDATPMPTHRVLNILTGLIERGLIALK